VVGVEKIIPFINIIGAAHYEQDVTSSKLAQSKNYYYKLIT